MSIFMIILPRQLGALLKMVSSHLNCQLIICSTTATEQQQPGNSIDFQGRTQGGEGGLGPPPSTQTYTGRPKRKL